MQDVTSTRQDVRCRCAGPPPVASTLTAMIAADDDLQLLRRLTPCTTWTDAVETLRDAGWSPCGTGDWAFALRSPGGATVARISPFDPAAPYTAALYREAATTGQVPRLIQHLDLAGGARLTVMEHLDPVPEADAAAFLTGLHDDPALAALAVTVRAVHERGAREQPFWGPLDANPDNVRRGLDGRLVLSDPYYADGPRLYRTAAEDPDAVVRAIPPDLRRHLTEIPLAASGPWEHGDRERLRATLAAADARAGN